MQASVSTNGFKVAESIEIGHYMKATPISNTQSEATNTIQQVSSNDTANANPIEQTSLNLTDPLRQDEAGRLRLLQRELRPQADQMLHEKNNHRESEANLNGVPHYSQESLFK